MAAFAMTTIAVLDKAGRDAVPSVIQALDSLKTEDSRFILTTSSELQDADNTQTLIDENVFSSIAIGCVFPKRFRRLTPQFTKNTDAVSVFAGNLYSRQLSNTQFTRRKWQSSMLGEAVLEDFLRESEGDFSVIVAEPSRILGVRDPLGVQPLYFGESKDFAALADNMTTLWKLGIHESCSFPPGNLAALTTEGFKFKSVKTLSRPKPRETTLAEAAQTLLTLLVDSVHVRVHGLKEVAVAFSGGLDSSVVAFLAKKCGMQVRLVHVSLAGQPETEDAKEVAEALGLSLSVYVFEADDVEETVSKVVGLIEAPDPVQIAIGTPFYWVAQKTAEAGFDVLLAGQGADELFGGYQRYVNEYIAHGEESVRETMFNDVLSLPHNNLERDKKICGFQGVDLRLPFASFEIAEFALSLAMALKIERKQDGLRKLVLRRLARDVGLPEIVVNKPKKAVQYATGVNAVLGKIAKKQSLTVGESVAKIFQDWKKLTDKENADAKLECEDVYFTL